LAGSISSALKGGGILVVSSLRPSRVASDDLYEVIDTLMSENNIAPDVVRAEQERRRQARGGFAQRIRLLSTSSSTNTDEP